MKYLIGDLISKHVQAQGVAYRRYALDRGMCETEFAQIRNGQRAASPEKLKTIIDIELLRDEVIQDLKTKLDEFSTETIITMYNIMYSVERDK